MFVGDNVIVGVTELVIVGVGVKVGVLEGIGVSEGNIFLSLQQTFCR